MEFNAVRFAIFPFVVTAKEQFVPEKLAKLMKSDLMEIKV